MTSEPMTAEQLAEVRKRGPVGYHCDHSDEPYDARTHHEWEYVEGEGHVFQHMPDVVSAHRGPREYLSLEQQDQRCPRALPVYDADVPALLAEVERLQAKEAADEQWGVAIDWLVNSRHTGDPEIQKAFWGIVDGRCTVDEADRGELADGSPIPDKMFALAESSSPTEEKG